jgi:hypothetical protein
MILMLPIRAINGMDLPYKLVQSAHYFKRADLGSIMQLQRD